MTRRPDINRRGSLPLNMQKSESRDFRQSKDSIRESRDLKRSKSIKKKSRDKKALTITIAHDENEIVPISDEEPDGSDKVRDGLTRAGIHGPPPSRIAWSTRNNFSVRGFPVRGLICRSVHRFLEIVWPVLVRGHLTFFSWKFTTFLRNMECTFRVSKKLSNEFG